MKSKIKFFKKPRAYFIMVIFLILIFINAHVSWPAEQTGNITDIDGNVYHTVAIGNQIWMVENLKVAKYRNGDPIPNVPNGEKWGGLTSGAYCDYENDSVNVSTYGRLYNWHSVKDSRNLCPSGWHVPTDTDWGALETYMGGNKVAGSKLKEAGAEHWENPNKGAVNSNGFAALPGGSRYSTQGTFGGKTAWGYWWTATQDDATYAWCRSMYATGTNVHRGRTNKIHGNSVRCVKD